MATIESLPADQRAVLDLVLQLGRSYDEVSELLSIERSAVRNRALAALDALGPQTRVAPERRALITDYLLSQLPTSLVPEVRRHLAQSASERAWARVVAAELQPIAKERSLSEIPTDGDAEPAAAAQPPQEEPQQHEPQQQEPPQEELSVPDALAEPAVLDGLAEPHREPEFDVAHARNEEALAAPATPAASDVPAARDTRRRPVWAFSEPQVEDEVAEEDSSPPPGHRPTRRRQVRRRSTSVSRRGGAILLAIGALIAVGIALVIVLSSGGSSHSSTSSAARSTTPTTSTSTSAQIVSQINLKPPSGTSKAIGIAEVLREKGKTGIAIVAQGLTPNSKRPANAYAVWLYNSPTDSHILGFVNPGVGKNGRLQTAGGLPSNASRYHTLLITLETRSNPRSPGTVVLSGQLKGL
jgi:hypothetical protein